MGKWHDCSTDDKSNWRRIYHLVKGGSERIEVDILQSDCRKWNVHTYYCYKVDNHQFVFEDQESYYDIGEEEVKSQVSERTEAIRCRLERGKK